MQDDRNSGGREEWNCNISFRTKQNEEDQKDKWTTNIPKNNKDP